ncbi:MAG: penicillin-binding protein 2 [Anaerolineaceae bacterium]
MLAPGRFERRIAATGTISLLSVLLFFGALAYWQVWRTDLATDAGNPRALAGYNDPRRGRILDRSGNELAVSLPSGQRRYTDASVAHAVGYLDARFGAQGAELVFNEELSGKAGPSFSSALNAEFLRTGQRGFDIQLTLDPVIQRAAATALGARKGAVIAIDPRNGEVLAMVSVPTYDPSAMASAGDALANDPNSPLLNRATQGLYPPGSTFKTVTASSLLENKVITPETVVTCKDKVVIDGFPVSCSNVVQGPGTYPFKNAFAFSVNAIFAEQGVKLGWDRLLETASKFGFGSRLPFTLPTAKTQVFAAGSPQTKTLLASTAFGQGEILATPLQMAEIAAIISNDGVLMSPHLGLAVLDGSRVVEKLEQPLSKRVLQSDIARTMRDLMVAVIDNGQAAGVAMSGVKIGGKTGTAELSDDGTSHAWFIAFAPAENPVIAVAVVVERGGRGGEVASPIAGQVIKAALRR